METRVEACNRQHIWSFKRAHIGGFVGVITAYVTLIISKLTNFPSDQLTWNAVAFFPPVVYAIVFVAMIWPFSRAMKKSRALDNADGRSFGSAHSQS